MSTQSEPRRIVLVDDEEALVWSLSSRLAKVRPRDTIEAANDGGAALTLLNRGRIDLLVADIRMPGMSGIDLVLAARGELPNLPVILMTAFKSPDVQRISSSGPFTALLEKPFDFDKLLKLVEQALAPPPRVGFSGAISVQTLPDIVQLYALSSATGLLVIRHGEDVGELWFDRGQLYHAVSRGARGDAAVYETMMWTGGEFAMRPGATSHDRSVSSSWQELLIESARRLDERDRSATAPPRDGWTPSLAPDALDDIAFGSVFEDLDPAKTPAVQPVAHRSSRTSPPKEVPMNIKDSLAKLNQMDGFVGAALVDGESGMLLGQEGGGSLNLEIASASNAEVVRAKRKAMGNLGIKDAIEDILISLGKQYHLIRPLRSRPTLFFYVALDRSRANLAMARIAVADVEKDLQV